MAKAKAKKAPAKAEPQANVEKKAPAKSTTGHRIMSAKEVEHDRLGPNHTKIKKGN